MSNVGNIGVLKFYEEQILKNLKSPTVFANSFRTPPKREPSERPCEDGFSEDEGYGEFGNL